MQDVEPIEPSPKRRKAAVLESRIVKVQNLKIKVAKKPAAAPKAKAAPKATPAPPGRRVGGLTKPRIAKTSDGRCELTATEDEWKRVHIWTARMERWGETLPDDMQAVADYIVMGDGRVTKPQVIALRDRLAAGLAQ